MLEGQSLGRSVGERTLFENVSFEISEGLMWVRGPSGSGKTELLKRVAGLVPGPGVLSLHGSSASSLGMPTWRSRVVYVPQLTPRWAGSGAEAWGRVRELAAQQGRSFDDPRALGGSWNLPGRTWDQPMSRLSGGEAQRVWLAISLATRPDAVLLDEPTSALDPEAVAAVEAGLAGRIGLLVTHSADQGARLSSSELVLA